MTKIKKFQLYSKVLEPPIQKLTGQSVKLLLVTETKLKTLKKFAFVAINLIP